MKKNILGIIAFGLITFYFSVTAFKNNNHNNFTDTKTGKITPDSLYHRHVGDLYQVIGLNEKGLPYNVFEKALTGYYNLRNRGMLSNRSILTIADFDQLSTKKRLYIINLDEKKIVLNTWVAHGQNSGADEAISFSNTNNSFASSLGFYVTGETYNGTHGRSLKLDGMDEGFNNNARSRSIVVHGAQYVSQGTINALGRLGRSQGCPAVAPEVRDLVIDNISNRTVLFINKSQSKYNSKLLDEQLAYALVSDTTHRLM